MSSLGWILIITAVATLVGSGILLFITVKYYWGERGTPPITGKQRRLQKEEELRLRARQIEHVARNPRETRKPSFWDNSKVR